MEEILKQINRRRIMCLFSLVVCIGTGCFFTYKALYSGGIQAFFLVIASLIIVIYFHAKFYKDYASDKVRPLLIQRFYDIEFEDDGLDLSEIERSGLFEKRKKYLGAEEEWSSKDSMAFDHDSVKLQTSYVRGIPPSTIGGSEIFSGSIYVYELPVSIKGNHVIKENYSGRTNKKEIINDDWLRNNFAIETTDNTEFNRMFSSEVVEIFKEIHRSIYVSKTYSFKGKKLYIAISDGKPDSNVTLLQNLEKCYFGNFKNNIDKTKEVMEKLRAMSYHFG